MSKTTESATKSTVALIPGASGAIGAAIAQALADGGAAVVVSGRNMEALSTTARGITAAGGHAVPIRAELTDPDSVAALRDAAESRLGPVGRRAEVQQSHRRVLPNSDSNHVSSRDSEAGAELRRPPSRGARSALGGEAREHIAGCGDGAVAESDARSSSLSVCSESIVAR